MGKTSQGSRGGGAVSVFGKSLYKFRLTLMGVGLIWFVFLINLTFFGYQTNDEDNEAGIKQLREDILRLSELYVKRLSRESQDIFSEQISDQINNHDLKKTLAVILDSLLTRMSQLEKQLQDAMQKNRKHLVHLEEDDNLMILPDVKDASVQIASNTSVQFQPNVSSNETSEKHKGFEENCELNETEEQDFPFCREKMNWMNVFWSTDECYAKFGVDGSKCSFRIYLSEIEYFCPPVSDKFRPKLLSTVSTSTLVEEAFWNFELENLIGQLKGSREQNYDWIRQRISRLWDRWIYAAKNLSLRQNFSGRRQKRILVHLGFLSQRSGLEFAKDVSKGGPLGELVQWSDIISALHLLGHQLTITSEFEDFERIIQQWPSVESQCALTSSLPLDVIYTDLIGLTHMEKRILGGFGKFSCLLRIIDSFGTEAEFNSPEFAQNKKSKWGKHGLNLQQHFTMFPHSPDNSFMGFVVEQHLKATNYNNITKKQQAVVYGKSNDMWKDKELYLEEIKKFVEIHATVFVDDRTANVSKFVPEYVKNHGLLSGEDLHRLLLESKLFIGLGFPYEGPAPLEAIANGCVFINPSFDPPLNRDNEQFFFDKPTLRKLSSQHPYAQDFISKPYVYTVDIHDLEQVQTVIKSALDSFNSNQTSMFHLPFEFTHEGMIQRVNAYLEHQDFCSPRSPVWPPVTAVTTIATEPGLSCKDACWQQKKICEPSHFKRINTLQTVEKFLGSSCMSVDVKSDIHFPAYEPETHRCFLQKDVMLFSCVGEVEGVTRICSCRDYIAGQTALCSSCL